MEILVFWLALIIVMFSYMTLWFGVSLYTKRWDVVDSAWGLGFILVAWLSLGLRGNFGALQVVSAILVSIWGLRLFVHIASRNWRKPADDQRYQALRAKWGEGADTKAYRRIFLLQGGLVLLVSAPMLALACTRSTPNVLSYLGWVIWVFGMAYEALADRQLATFIAHRPKNSHAIMDKGLWRYSRHPNYFGEVVVWWGAALVAISASNWWGVIGALVITFLITRVSGIPPLEKRYDGNKAYETYRSHTPVLIPRFIRAPKP
jgi:steroid 5-alpha reductase family enzyme